MAGPGNTKLTMENLLRKDPDLRKNEVLVEGFDLSGSDGVRALVKSDGFRKVASDSVLVEVQEAVEEAIRRISRGERRIAYTLPRVSEAARAGAVEKCIVSDDVFASNVDENALVKTLNVIEEKGGKVFLCDSSLETGKQVSALGGMVALLRYDLSERPGRYFAKAVTAGITYSVSDDERHASNDQVLAQPPPEVGEVEQDPDEQAGDVSDAGDVDHGRVDRW